MVINMIQSFKRMPPPWKFASIALATAAGLLAGVYGPKYLAEQRWEPGAAEVATTHKALDAAADRLDKFEMKGDAQGAIGMMDSMNFLLRNIENAPFKSGAMRNCQLAAAHLADGVLDVAKGTSWKARFKFENALADCS